MGSMKTYLPQRCSRASALALLVMTASWALPAAAQYTTHYPMQANPGTLVPGMPSPGYQQQAPLSAPGMLPRETDAPTISVPEQAPIVQVEADTFYVSRIDVQGNSIIPDAEMQLIAAPYEGRHLAPEDLSALVARINEVYRNKGFLTSMAFVPPQDLDRGTITVRVLEGMVGELEVTGNKYFKAKVVERRISSAHEPGKPLNLPQLEKELLRINRQEPYRVRALLTPGALPGETDVRLEVQEQQPFQIALTADNLGRPYIGTYRFGGELMHRNVTGRGDRALARYMVGAGQHIASGSYSLPIGSKGTEVSALFGFSNVDVDLGVRNQPDIVGRAYNMGLLLSQPLDADRRFVADLGLNARRASSFFDGDKVNTDDVRSATVGLTFNNYDRLGRSFARVQSSFAPDWLGANTSFWKLESFATRVTRLPKRNLLILRSYSQFTPGALPPIEQFQLGGVNSVRGYSEGLLIGDRGYTLNAEWRWPIPFAGKVSPWVAERLQGALFFDFGQTWMDKDNRNYIAGVSNSHGRTTLMGSGVGLRAHLTDRMQGYVDFGFGMVKRQDVEPYSQPTARVHFGVRSELLPNDYKARNDEVTPIKTHVVRPRAVGALRQADLDSYVSDPTLEPIDMVRRNVQPVY